MMHCWHSVLFALYVNGCTPVEKGPNGEREFFHVAADPVMGLQKSTDWRCTKVINLPADDFCGVSTQQWQLSAVGLDAVTPVKAHGWTLRIDGVNVSSQPDDNHAYMTKLAGQHFWGFNVQACATFDIEVPAVLNFRLIFW